MELWLVYLIAAAVLVVASVLVVLILRLSRAVAEAQQLLARVNEMTPRVDRILAETEAELAEIRQVTQKVNAMATHALTITEKAAAVAHPVLDTAGSFAKPLKYITATVAGIQAVMQLFRQRHGQNHDADQESDDATSEVSGGATETLTPRPQSTEV